MAGFWHGNAALLPDPKKQPRSLVLPFLAALLVIALQVVLTYPHLLVRAPYEEWDEITSHNSTLPISIESRVRVPTYGTLEDAKFSVVRWIYTHFDPVTKEVPPGVYANSVPASWENGSMLLGPKTWHGESIVDYNYVRGISDRQVFHYARIINSPLFICCWSSSWHTDSGFSVAPSG